MIYEGKNYRIVYDIVAKTEKFLAILIKEIYYEDMKLENFAFESYLFGELMRVTNHEEVIIENSERLWENFFYKFNNFRSDEGRFKINSERIFIEQLFI